MHIYLYSAQLHLQLCIMYIYAYAGISGTMSALFLQYSSLFVNPIFPS